MKIAPPPIGKAFVLIVSNARLEFRISSESVPITNGNSSLETSKTTLKYHKTISNGGPGWPRRHTRCLMCPPCNMRLACGGSGETPICDFVDISVEPGPPGRRRARFWTGMGADGAPKATRNPSENRWENRCPKSVKKHRKTQNEFC